MGLLKITEIRGTPRETETEKTQEDAGGEAARLRRELADARRRNDELVSRLNRMVQVVKEQNRSKRDLQQRIMMNPKTGLPNHHSMDEDLQSFFAAYMEDGELTPGALAVIKLDDNYSIINKTLKPTVSEWIIYQIATRLKEIFSESTPIYHSREDEFIIFLKRTDTHSEVVSVIEKIESEVIKPHIFSGYHITIACRIGVSFFPENGAAKGILLNKADIALNHAKKNNRPYVFYAEHMRRAVVRNMELQNSIIHALEDQSIREIDKQFLIHMQPIVKVRDIIEGLPRIERMDAELLIRWRHPEKGIIGPDTFIPIAEETGLIIIIGKWVLYGAAAQIESWQEAGTVHSGLSINVSPRQFNNDDLLESVERIVNFRSVDPAKLQIEITENSFLDDPDEASRKISKLKDLGIRIAIDDFGTGFSAVNYLRKLPVDVVKIDRSFITNIVESRSDRSIVKALIAMTGELGMSTIAEGVETMEQLELLIEYGIDRYQGFLFSPPLPVDEYDILYKKSTA